MCDTLVARTDSGWMFAKNSDRDPNEAQFLDWRPAAQHPDAGSVRCTWTTIPQVPRTRAVLLSRPWWMWGAEMGTNDAGVVIGNEAVFTDSHEESTGLLGMDLLRLALERSGTAEDAVQVIVTLLERYGQGGSASFEHPRFSYDNSFLILDPDGAVVLETAGREWATETVKGPGRSISNGLTIRSFAKAHHDRLRSGVAACRVRRELTTAGAEAATGLADMATTLRSHGPAGAPRYRLHNGAMAAPCMHAGGLVTSSQTTASWISDLSDGQNVHWVTATAAPCTSIFLPTRVDDPLDLGPRPTNLADEQSIWWRHERLHRVVLKDPVRLFPRLQLERDRVERTWFADPPASTDAVRVAEELRSRWTRDIADLELHDARPAVVRRMWRRWNRAAGLTPAQLER